MPFPEQEAQEKSKFGNRDVAFRFKYTDAGGIFEHICLVGSWKYSCGAEESCWDKRYRFGSSRHIEATNTSDL